MKKVDGLFGACTSNSARVIVVLAALIAVSAVQAEVDVCKGNGYTMEVGGIFEPGRKDDEICSYRAGADAVVMIRGWPGLDREQIEKHIKSGYSADGIALLGRGELSEILTEGGAGYLAEVDGFVGGRIVEGLAGGFIGDDGQGVMFLISSLQDKWAEYQKQADAIIQSIRFTEYVERITRREWQRMLGGVRLSYEELTESGEYREDYNFCSDGRFISTSTRTTRATGDEDAMFGFSTDRDYGDWYVRSVDGSTQLVLRYGNGHENWAVIEDRDGETWVDDRRYYMLENKRCR